MTDCQLTTSTYLYDAEGLRVIRSRMVFAIQKVAPSEANYIQLVCPARPR
jgi:hypothetical protein